MNRPYPDERHPQYSHTCNVCIDCTWLGREGNFDLYACRSTTRGIMLIARFGDGAVDAFALEWRKWRRSMHLTIAEAAAMAGVNEDWLQRCEVGTAFAKSHEVTYDKLRALMARWNEDMRPAKKFERRGGPRARRVKGQ